MSEIDLSPQTLKEHRELAERVKFRHPDTRKESDLMAFMGSTSAEFVITMIDEIERLRKKNSRLFEIWKALPPTLMEQKERLEKEADWLAEMLVDAKVDRACFEFFDVCNSGNEVRCWREAARNAVASLKA